MIRWLPVIFVALILLHAFLPSLEKLGVGRIPGDVRFRLRERIYCLPFASTVICFVMALIIAEIA